MPSMGGGGRSGGDDTSGGASKGNGGMGSSGSGGESSGGKSSSRSDYGPTKSGGNLADSWGKGESSYREGPGRTGPNGKTQSWTAMDGWHDVDTSLSAPSYFSGRMATPWGAKHPGQYGRERTAFNVAKNKSDLERAYAARQATRGQLPSVNALDVGTVRGIRQDINEAIDYGNLAELRDKYGLDTIEMEKAHKPSGFANTLISFFGGHPDKVETQPGLAKELRDQGLVEYDAFGNLQVTDKGVLSGSATGLSAMNPAIGYVVGGLTHPVFGNLATNVVNRLAYKNKKIGPAIKNSMNMAGGMLGKPALAVAAGPLGAMYDMYDLGSRFENAGIYGGKSMFDLGFDGKVNGINQDVYDRTLNRAEKRATPNELSESYPTNTNLSTPSNWPTFENTQQQPYQNQPWSWEQWNNYFR